MRGTLDELNRFLNGRRFIPAYAGNAQTLTFTTPTGTVHPRVCGERRPPNVEIELDGGSSPRMRGTLSDRAATGQNGRFIPAYAGNASLDRA